MSVENVISCLVGNFGDLVYFFILYCGYLIIFYPTSVVVILISCGLLCRWKEVSP